MLRRHYTRAPWEDPTATAAAKDRFSEGSQFEPGHRRQVRIFRPFKPPARAWYDRLRGMFWIGGEWIGEVTHWERLAPVAGRRIAGKPST